MIKPIPLSAIDIANSPRVRHEVRHDVVQDYMQNYLNQVPMPAPTLFEVEKGRYLIGDGLHRVNAMLGLSKNDFKGPWEFEVKEGSYDECLRHALRANLTHGLRRSNEDKKQSAKITIETFPNLSNVQLSEIAGVSDRFIAEVKKSLVASGTVQIPKKTVGKDGRPRRANLERIEVEVSKCQQNDTNSEADPDLDSEPARVVAGSAIIKESLGITVPAKALVYWERGSKVEEMMKDLSNIKCTIDKAQKAGDRMFVEISNSVLADLSMCRQGVSYALPYTVCPTCNGQLVEKCGLCRGRGVISKELYQTVPVEIRNMREKLAKKGGK